MIPRVLNRQVFGSSRRENLVIAGNNCERKLELCQDAAQLQGRRNMKRIQCLERMLLS